MVRVEFEFGIYLICLLFGYVVFMFEFYGICLLIVICNLRYFSGFDIIFWIWYFMYYLGIFCIIIDKWLFLKIDCLIIDYVSDVNDFRNNINKS